MCLGIAHAGCRPDVFRIIMTDFVNFPLAGRSSAFHRSRRIEASLDCEDFHTFGLILEHNGHPGRRTDFTQIFEVRGADNRPRLHVNRIDPSTLPLMVASLERHPDAWQSFIPLDVSRYIVCVANSLPDGLPDPDSIRAWIRDGRSGVAFAPGVWHASAAVLDRSGQFAVIWPRRDRHDDTEVHTLPLPVLIEPRQP